MTLSSTRTRLNCEQLESRSNPANVGVSYVGGILTITGDNNSNLFIVQENQLGDYFVEGGTGTLINGKSAINLGNITPNNINISDGNGNDHIAIYGVHAAGNLVVITGISGNAFVNISGAISSYMEVDLRGSNNTLETSAVTARVGAYIVASGKGFNVWVDNGLSTSKYLVDSGWSEISG
jgi:hypothetical protein